MSPGDVGRVLILCGLLIVVVGVVLMLLGRVPWLGRLPGDLRIERGNLTCFVPLATSLLLSLVLTIVLNVLVRLLRR